LSNCQQKIFLQGNDCNRWNTLCISRLRSAALWEKICCTGGKMLSEPEPIKSRSLIKKGAGRNNHSPCYHSRFALSEAHACWLPKSNSGRQNLAALCTATGKNLAAVGSSHSLTETVNLGTVTTAGLIGTLHFGTPPVKITYAQQPNGRSNAYYMTIVGQSKVL